MKELREEIGIKTPENESQKQNEMVRTYAKNERRQTVKKSTESRRRRGRPKLQLIDSVK